MGLKGDIEEVTSSWKSASPLMKAWLFISLFLASGSVASLSETIIKWKIFILDAVVFYQQIISLPLQRVLSELVSFEVPMGFSDIVVVFTLVLSASIKALFSGNNLSGYKHLAIGGIIGLIITSLGIVYAEKEELSYRAILASIIGMALIVAFFIYLSEKRAFILWLIYVLSPLVVVGILGAINSAL